MIKWRVILWLNNVPQEVAEDIADSMSEDLDAFATTEADGRVTLAMTMKERDGGWAARQATVELDYQLRQRRYYEGSKETPRVPVEELKVRKVRVRGTAAE